MTGKIVTASEPLSRVRSELAAGAFSSLLEAFERMRIPLEHGVTGTGA